MSLYSDSVYYIYICSLYQIIQNVLENMLEKCAIACITCCMIVTVYNNI